MTRIIAASTFIADAASSAAKAGWGRRDRLNCRNVADSVQSTATLVIV
jgi:hypothetical protein